MQHVVFKIIYETQLQIKKFDFYPGNLSIAVYIYEKPPNKISGFLGLPVSRAINFKIFKNSLYSRSLAIADDPNLIYLKCF